MGLKTTLLWILLHLQGPNEFIYYLLHNAEFESVDKNYRRHESHIYKENEPSMVIDIQYSNKKSLVIEVFNSCVIYKHHIHIILQSTAYKMQCVTTIGWNRPNA